MRKLPAGCGCALVGVFGGLAFAFFGGGSADWALGLGLAVAMASVPAYMLWVNWQMHRLPRDLRLLGHRSAGTQTLDRLLADRQRAITVLLRALAVPRLAIGKGSAGGRVMHLPSGGPELSDPEQWDYRLARQRAIEGLGRLQATEAVEPLLALLDDDEPEAREAAARALVAIGDRRVVPRLVGLLDAEAANYAAAGLRELGEGDLAGRFAAAFGGDVQALRPVVAEHRAELAEALGRALLSVREEVSAAAARALGELGLMEALPELRGLAGPRSATDAATRAACQDALARLEGLLALPREAAPTVDEAALPRSVGDQADAAAEETADGG